MFLKVFITNLAELVTSKAVPGSVLICFGIPLSAMHRCKNSITLLVVGARKNSTSCQSVLLSIDTIRYFWSFVRFRKFLRPLLQFSRLFIPRRVFYQRYVASKLVLLTHMLLGKLDSF